ncbi:MAG: GxxExxY protein [Myxococcota bacterium]
MALIQEELTNTILGAAVEVHRLLGPRLLESVYARCLVHELELRGIAVTYLRLSGTRVGLMRDGMTRVVV